MGVQTKGTNMTTNQNTKRLARGTPVVSTEDGEAGTILRVCTFQRNGIDAWSYLVETAYGREIWHRGDLFVPATQRA